ncbi:MAG: hypothetical protein ACJ75J_14665 [Cytophagaceae bacterium]
MLLKFEELPESSHVWVYPSDRPLTEKELDSIKIRTAAFISSWESHGTPVPASFKILFDRFLVIAADESGFNVSGCSMDKSVHFLKELQNELGIDFFNRTLLPFKSGNTISFYKMTSVKSLIQEETIHENDIFLNTLVPTLKDLKNSFEIRAVDSFLAKYWPAKKS